MPPPSAVKDYGILFLKREVQDETLVAQCQTLLDHWSNSIPFSPVKQLGTKSDFVSATEFAAYRTTVTTQIEKRWLEDHEVPFRGQLLPAQFRPKSQVDPWKINFPRFADFASHRHSIDLPDTRKACDCSTCRASGKVTCSSCSGSGKVTCYKCRGRGQNQKTREIPYIAVCTTCSGTGKSDSGRGSGTCYSCGGGRQVNKTRTEEYYVPCGTCAASGKVTCSTCRGSGEVRCPRCEGQGRLLAYATAEQTEEPAKGEHQFVPTELPQFKKNDHPISKLEGELVFAQDEQSRIAPLGFSDQQAATVLSAEVETCRNEHKGHVLRQQINVERCSIVEYSYRHSGMTHTIFINPKHSLVEDIAGPIQTAIEHMDALAKKAFDEKRYEEAYRLNLRSLCMDEATNEEKQLRDQILKRLTSSYRNTALITWLLASLSWMFLCSPAPGQDVSNIGGFLGLLPLLGAVFLFARDPALRFRQRGSRLVCAVLLGFSAFLSGATISLNSLCGLNDRPWDDWLPFGGVILLLVVIALARAKERSRRLKIETHLKEFSTPQALEAYVCGLDPKDRTEFRAILGMSVVLLCLLATVVVAKLTTEKAAAEAKALAEKEAADAKALAENAAAEAKALAKASAEKRLEWTGKAMQRAGMKAETVKHTLTQGGTVVAWGKNREGQTTVPAGMSGVVAIAAGGYHTVALKQVGTVVAWGSKGYGETTVPAGLSGVVAIAAGGEHTVALKLE